MPAYPARARSRSTPSPLSLAAQAPFREPARRVEIVLPRPISKNRLHGAGRGRVFTSAEYRGWQAECGWLIQAHQPRLGCVRGPYRLTIEMNEGEFGRHDVANAETAISDLLQAHAIVENDRRAAEVTSKWGPAPGVVVTVTAVEDSR